jgi:hypothetical protein
MSQTLDQALNSLEMPETLPHPLPAGHLTEARNLDTIATLKHLTPWPCKVFKEDLLYVFYGGLFYRRSAVPTSNAAFLPVGFVFQPLILQLVDRYYPFDTGAAQSKKYGADWHTKLRPFKKMFRVNGGGDYRTPAGLVYHLFGTNDAYLYGDPRPADSAAPEPLPTLLAFLADEPNLTARGVDQRFRRIEGHAKVPIPLDDKLIWIGYPEGFEEQFSRVCECLQPVLPLSFCYKSHPARRPSEMAAVLEQKATEDVIGMYVDYRPGGK